MVLPNGPDFGDAVEQKTTTTRKQSADTKKWSTGLKINLGKASSVNGFGNFALLALAAGNNCL